MKDLKRARMSEEKTYIQYHILRHRPDFQTRCSSCGYQFKKGEASAIIKSSWRPRESAYWELCAGCIKTLSTEMDEAA